MNFREQLKNIYPFEGEAKNTQEKKQKISELGLTDRLKSFKSKAALAAAVAFLGTFSKMEGQTSEGKNQDANKEKTEYVKTGENDGDVYKVTTKEKNKKIEGGHKYKKVIIEKGDIQKESLNTNEVESRNTNNSKETNINPSWPELKDGFHYNQKGQVLDSNGNLYKGSESPFKGGFDKQDSTDKKEKNDQNKKQLKQGYKYGPNGFIIDENGNPAKENPFIN